MRFRTIFARPWRHSPVEEVRVLFLNAKNMLIANEAMWRGSVDEASMHVREVMKRAMAHGATAIIIVHNHPSGDPTPSQADVKLTRELVEAGRHMNEGRRCTTMSSSARSGSRA